MRTKLESKASIPDLLRTLTVEEKLKLLTGRSLFLAGGLPEYGIPHPLFLDGGTGFNTMQMNLEAYFRAYEEANGEVAPESCPGALDGFGLTMGVMAKLEKDGEQNPEAGQMATRAAEILDATRPADRKLGCYPPGMFLGATMNPDVIYRCGEALGREASACHIDVLLGTPNVNLHRDPRCGRLFEGYSEDPCVVATLAPHFVRGVQDTGVVANVKHFAANNQETDRMGVDESISERALRELYLPGFRACVDAGCKTVMSAYNQINGKPCAQNAWLLRDVLRKEWGFRGFVMSDWGAVYDRVEAQNAGNDVCMPGPRSIQALLAAVEDGRLSLETIDEACRNYLNILLEMPVLAGRRYTAIDCDYSMAAAYAAAAEGITLLKNDGLLPLSRESRVAFYGQRSKKFCESGAGSAQVATELSTNLFDATAEKIGAASVRFESVGPDTDCVVVTIGANGQEGADRPTMEMEPEDLPVLERAIGEAKAAGKPVVLVLNIAAPVDLCDFIDQVDAVLCVYLPGMAGGQAAADILFGDVNPSGKLPLTYPKHYRDTPTAVNFPGEYAAVTYGEGIYVGYRYYDKKRIEPLFPFGFGLSYTTFALTNLCVTPQVRFDQGEQVEVAVDLSNTGHLAGSEVVQLYIADPESTLDKPVKELKGLKKVHLEPGETAKVRFTLSKEALASYDTKLREWTTEPGEYVAMVGTSARDIAQCASFQAICYNPYGLRETTEIAKLVADPTAIAVLKRHLPDCDPMTLVNADIVFTPRAAFRDIWAKRFAPVISGTAEEKAAVFRAICRDFEAANASGAVLPSQGVSLKDVL